MFPVNQVFLGNSDPLLTQSDINNQIQLLKQYELKLNQLKDNVGIKETIWDNIDAEMSPLTETQKAKFFEDREYVEINTALQNIVQIELLNLVKDKIEKSQEGNELLKRQLKIVKKLKNKIIEETDNEMAIFKKFKEFSKDNPNLTYEEFCKQWHNTSM